MVVSVVFSVVQCCQSCHTLLVLPVCFGECAAFWFCNAPLICLLGFAARRLDEFMIFSNFSELYSNLSIYYTF